MGANESSPSSPPMASCNLIGKRPAARIQKTIEPNKNQEKKKENVIKESNENEKKSEK